CKGLWRAIITVRRQCSRRTQMTGTPLTPHDHADGTIREGEPPYFSGHGSDAGSTSNLASPPSVHPVMRFLVWYLRIVAVLLAGWAAFWTYFAMWFRLEGSDELKWIRKADLELGGIFALAVVLFFVPERLKKPIQCLLIFGIAALVWSCVSGYLIA